jgi:hypothetical protein
MYAIYSIIFFISRFIRVHILIKIFIIQQERIKVNGKAQFKYINAYIFYIFDLYMSALYLYIVYKYKFIGRF